MSDAARTHFHLDGALPERPETLFVFGSNLAGRHGKGAARVARECFGAIPGQGQGRQGRSWAIPTKDAQLQTLSREAITKEIDAFIADIASLETPQRLFLTRIGCGLAGYRDEQIAPLFRGLKLLAPHAFSVPEPWRPWFESPLPTYAGIGSRNTPAEVQRTMTQVAERLRRLGYVLRTGGADGADTAFATGAGFASELFLPWYRFKELQSRFSQPSEEAFTLAAEVHPAWERLSGAAKKLMARNSHQILGPDLKTPSRFVLCWTPDGAESEAERSRKTGGTGQAIAMADRRGIPVYNLAKPDALMRLRDERLLA